MRHRFARVCLSAVVSASVGLGTACATNPATGRPDLVMMSEDQEIALGRKYHWEIQKVHRVYEDSELRA